MNIIEKEWEEFKSCFKNPIPNEELEVMLRSIFYGGFASGAAIVAEVLSNDEDDIETTKQKLTDILSGLGQYEAEIISTMAIIKSRSFQ